MLKRNEDAGAIIQNMCLKATDLGLSSVFNYSIAQRLKIITNYRLFKNT